MKSKHALHQFGLDGVVFVPTGQPWMKEHEVVSGPEDRYLMTVIATASNPLFRVSPMAVDRDGPTYTVDTLRGMKAELGEDTDLFFVTGADAILEIFQLKHREELFDRLRQPVERRLNEFNAQAEARAVMESVREAVTPGEFDDVLSQLPQEYRELVGPMS